MNERQRDLFLYIWSQRRKRGQAAVALRGGAIGALGGVLFALILGSTFDAPVNGSVAAILPVLQRAGTLLALSIPAFAFIGYVGANRVFASQEAMYQAMLASGARVPDTKPQMQAADRWPAIAVGITVVLIAGFILALLIAFW